MPDLFCDGPSEEDDFAQAYGRERMLARPRPARPQEFAVPIPPGWIKAFDYGQQPGTYQAAYAGMWVAILSRAQAASQQARTRLHAVVRDRRGDRVLLVHPSLGELAAGIVNDLEGHWDCCGWGQICAPEQQRAEIVFARRHWRTLSLAERADIARAAGVGLRAALGRALPDIVEGDDARRADLICEVMAFVG